MTDTTPPRLDSERESLRAHSLLMDVAAAGSLAAYAARKNLPVSAVRRDVLAAQRHAGELDVEAAREFEAGLVECPLCRGQEAPEGLSGQACGFCSGEGRVHHKRVGSLVVLETTEQPPTRRARDRSP